VKKAWPPWAAHGPYAVVVADMQMPGMNGIQFLTKAEEKTPDTVRIMLTGMPTKKQRWTPSIRGMSSAF